MATSLRPFARLFFNRRCTNAHISPNVQLSTDLCHEHSGKCHFSQERLAQVPFRWSLHGMRLILPAGLRLLGLFAFAESFTSCDLGCSGEGAGWVAGFWRLHVAGLARFCCSSTRLCANALCSRVCIERRSWLCRRLGTLVCIVPETAIVSFRTPPYGFPLPTITVSFKNMTLPPLILDQHVWLNSLWFLASKFLVLRSCSILFLTIVFSRW